MLSLGVFWRSDGRHLLHEHGGRLFRSKLGPPALAALSFTFPIYLIVTAFSSGLGNGVVAVIARAVGAGDKSGTKALGTDGLLLTVSIGVLLSVVGYATINPLFTFLGADAAVMPLVKDYMHVWYLGVVLVIFPQVSQTIARAHAMPRHRPTSCGSCRSSTWFSIQSSFSAGPDSRLRTKGRGILHYRRTRCLCDRHDVAVAAARRLGADISRCDARGANRGESFCTSAYRRSRPRWFSHCPMQF